ncbi:MAG: hypothetical protein ACLUT2_00675 [Clostridium sp.]
MNFAGKDVEIGLEMDRLINWTGSRKQGQTNKPDSVSEQGQTNKPDREPETGTDQ